MRIQKNTNYSPNAYYVRAVRAGQPRLLDHLIISSPVQGSIWNAGDTLPITWDTSGMSGTAAISISRQGGKTGTFETIIASTENDGAYNWTVTGPGSVNCVLKIEPAVDPTKGTTQGLFSIVPADGAVAEISGTPDDPTNETGAELTVSGDGVTHYKYKLNDGEYGAVTPASETIILSGLLDGPVTVSVIAGGCGRELAGGGGMQPRLPWTVDAEAPASEATPAGGTYGTNQDVTLSCNDGSGSGCAAIYYTLNGNDPTDQSSPYGSPITISGNTTLKFFAVDLAGNAESVNTQVYTRTYETDHIEQQRRIRDNAGRRDSRLRRRDGRKSDGNP